MKKGHFFYFMTCMTLDHFVQNQLLSVRLKMLGSSEGEAATP